MTAATFIGAATGISGVGTGATTAQITITLLYIVGLLFSLLLLAGLVYFIILVVRALLKYLRTTEVKQEKAELCRSLGETLKAQRMEGKMTQEFVAEAIGVSRQAVSKWESGASDPSTSNLFALAKLYGITVEELFRRVKGQTEQ